MAMSPRFLKTVKKRPNKSCHPSKLILTPPPPRRPSIPPFFLGESGKKIHTAKVYSEHCQLS